MKKSVKTIGIVTAVLIAVSFPAYTYAKPAIGNNLLTATVAAKKSIAWNSKVIFKKAVKVKKKLTVLGLTTLNDTHIKGDVTLDNGLALGSLTGLTAGQIIMGNADGTPTATTLSGDVTVDSSGVATVTTDAVTVDDITTTVTEDSGETDGIVKYRIISEDTVLPLLDGVSNTLTTFDTDEIVLDVIMNTGSASGTAGTVDIGTDANWGAAASDADAFIVDHDLNTAGVTRMTLQDETNQSAAASGNPAKADGAIVTIQSSADMSTSDFTGNVIILYY